MKRGVRGFLLLGLLVALLLAGGVSSFASSDPDGLDNVTREGCDYRGEEITGGECMARHAGEHEVGGPLADYGVVGIDNPYLSTAIAGVSGVLVVFLLGMGMVWFARRGRRTQRAAATGSAPQASRPDSGH
ncbi:MAG: PDGLE domain-containing protein [Micromonosporaceae bacterium]